MFERQLTGIIVYFATIVFRITIFVVCAHLCACDFIRASRYYFVRYSTYRAARFVLFYTAAPIITTSVDLRMQHIRYSILIVAS